MTIYIQDNKLVGKVRMNSAFLNGSPDAGVYNVEVDFTGADIALVVKHAYKDGVIVLRKRIKTREQAQALDKGITFAQMVSAAPKDSNSMALSLNPDELTEEVKAALIAKLTAKTE